MYREAVIQIQSRDQDSSEENPPWGDSSMTRFPGSGRASVPHAQCWARAVVVRSSPSPYQRGSWTTSVAFLGTSGDFLEREGQKSGQQTWGLAVEWGWVSFRAGLCGKGQGCGWACATGVGSKRLRVCIGYGVRVCVSAQTCTRGNISSIFPNHCHLPFTTGSGWEPVAGECACCVDTLNP